MASRLTVGNIIREFPLRILLIISSWSKEEGFLYNESDIIRVTEEGIEFLASSQGDWMKMKKFGVSIERIYGETLICSENGENTTVRIFYKEDEKILEN